ncbi:hypothetical protein GCM10028775_46650 [Catellatospora paridis]
MEIVRRPMERGPAPFAAEPAALGGIDRRREIWPRNGGDPRTARSRRLYSEALALLGRLLGTSTERAPARHKGSLAYYVLE